MARVLTFYVFLVTLSVQMNCAVVDETDGALDHDVEIEIVDDESHPEMESPTTALDSQVVREYAFSTTPPESPMFRAIKDFLLQVRSTLVDPTAIPETDSVPLMATTEQIVEALEQGFKDATEAVLNEIGQETSTFSTVQELSSDEPETTQSTNDSGRIFWSAPEVHEPTQGLAANLSISCSTCYNELNSCVQQCFARHNCNDLERDARQCPPVPTRLCNPFTPWSPIDQCQIDEDCESPLLCCNDGCVKRCTKGEWKSGLLGRCTVV